MKHGLLSIVLATAAVFAGAAPAAAHELKPAWGYAFIDDNPFNDPTAGGALLPATQAFPRGSIRDTVVDQKDVRITVTAVSPTGPAFVYTVVEGDFKDVSINRKLNVAPEPITAMRYDFCRINADTKLNEVCVPPYVINRPPPPPPSAPPPPDRDGDGVPVPLDCADTNSTVHPGAREVPGNGIDDDCSAGDQAGRLSAIIKFKWATRRGRTRALQLAVSGAPAGAAVEVRCRGRGCPFRRKATTAKAGGGATLKKYFKRRLRAGITIDVRVTAPNSIGKMIRFKTRRQNIPSNRTYCLPPGASKPQRHC